MSKRLLTLTIMLFLSVCGCAGGQYAGCNQTKEPMLAHNVYFRLKDDSQAAKNRLVDSCHQYLKDHPGVVFFAAGTLAEELDRPVNVRDFHVGLHIVFKAKKFHDQYQTADKHLQFIEENKGNWENVRVFDTLVR
jgi:hypothetical protein